MSWEEGFEVYEGEGVGRCVEDLDEYRRSLALIRTKVTMAQNRYPNCFDKVKVTSGKMFEVKVTTCEVTSKGPNLMGPIRAIISSDVADPFLSLVEMGWGS